MASAGMCQIHALRFLLLNSRSDLQPQHSIYNQIAAAYKRPKFAMAYKAPLVVPALKRHTATVIVAHGLGDSGAGW